MKIGIDARWIFKELSGIGVYTRELIRALSALDAENSYVLFFNSEELRERTLSETGAEHAPNFSVRMVPFGLFSPANQWRMPSIIRKLGLDIFHSTNYMIPLPAFPAKRAGRLDTVLQSASGKKNRTRRVRCVTTVHDLIPLAFPEYAPRSRKNRFFPLYRLIMREVGMRSDVIITDSDSSRADVLHHLRIAPDREDRVLTIPVGVSPVFRQHDGSVCARTNGTSKKKTVLWVGRPDPYKNLVGLIKAFARARSLCSFSIELRLAGPHDDRYPEAREAASLLGVENDIVWLGYVSDAQLVREYQQAGLLALPSRYEGFGLPVIEAMACGTPVICSDRGSLPEVAGDIAIQVGPDDIEGLAAAIAKVLSDERMAGDMIERGLRHASRYTWRATATETLRAYRKALE